MAKLWSTLKEGTTVMLPKPLESLSPRPGASDELIADAEWRLGAQLPDEYKSFLRTSDGIEGFVGPESYLMLWSVSELMKANQLNSPQDRDRFPGLTLIGSNGSDTAYGIVISDAAMSYVSVPYIELEPDAVGIQASSLVGFLEHVAADPIGGAGSADGVHARQRGTLAKTIASAAH